MNQLFTRTTGIFAAMTAVIILTLAAAMNVSAQSGTPDWRLPVTGLTAAAGDQAGDLDLTWNAHPQTTKTLSDYRVTWTPDGEDFKNNDQTGLVRLSNHQPSDGYGPRRRSNLQGPGPCPLRRQQKVPLERCRLRPDRPAY